MAPRMFTDEDQQTLADAGLLAATLVVLLAEKGVLTMDDLHKGADPDALLARLNEFRK